MTRPGERPHVFVNVAVSVDGRIDSALREGGGFSSREDKRRLAAIRELADALVVGASTIRNEDPPLHVASDAARGRRRAAGREEELVVVIVSATGRIQPDARFLREPARARLLAVPEALPGEALEGLGELIDEGRLEILRVGRERVEPALLLSRLAESGVRDVLVEGGGETIGVFVGEDLVDELFVTLVPVVIGGRDAPGPVGGEPRALSGLTRLELESCEELAGELFLRYTVVRRGAVEDGSPA